MRNKILDSFAINFIENHFDEISFETIFFLNTIPNELMDTTHTEFVLHNVESLFLKELSHVKFLVYIL